MTTTWVVVAHQTGARFMEHRSGFGKHLTLVREIENPEGRLKNSEINSDRAGAVFARMQGRSGRRALHSEQTAHEHVRTRFAHDLAEQVNRARVDGLFEDLILVAEPKFLGLLRDALDPPTAHRVVGSATKDLAGVPPSAVASHIADLLPL